MIALPTHIDPLGGQTGCPVNIELLISAPDSTQQAAHLGRDSQHFPVSSPG